MKYLGTAILLTLFSGVALILWAMILAASVLA